MALRSNMSDPLRIWAPVAQSVEVLLGEHRISADAETDGWWRGPVLHSGMDYLISLDGGAGRPDPRSRWQPHGAHGPSRWVDPLTLCSPLPPTFRHVPLRDAVIYEMHVGTFTEAGTFIAAAKQLDHLVELGITHVEVMPIAQWSGRYGWGYDGVGLYAPHDPYGGPPGLHYFIRVCHEKQLGVIIDAVYNHFGPEGAYHAEFGPYRTSKHQTPWGDAINLDGERSPEVRRFLIDSALQWLRDYGADGLRLDAVHAFRDDSSRHFVAELVDEVRALERELGRPYLLIGEYDDHDSRAVMPRPDGWGLNAHWNDDFHHAVHALLTGEGSGYLRDFIARGTLTKVLLGGYALDGGMSVHRGKSHGKPFGKLSRDRLVAYVQSHDQVGNRAGGERLHQLAGRDKAMIAAALLMTAPFVPMLFQGEEWAASTPFCYFVDFESKELRAAVRNGRRAEHAALGWVSEELDPTSAKTRDASVLRWSEVGLPMHQEMLAWYRQLLAARRDHAELRDPAPESTVVHETLGGIQIDRGALSLCVNLSSGTMASSDGDCILSSKPLHGGKQLAPVSCALFAR